MAKKIKEQQVDAFEQMVGSATVDPKKKNNKPVIKLNKTDSKLLIDFLEAKKAYKEAEGNVKTLAGPLLELCLKRQDKDGLNKDFHGSYSVYSDDEEVKAIFVTQDKWSPSQEILDIASIKKILGKENEDELIKKNVVTLKEEVFTTPELKLELVKLVGESFSKFFETKQVYSMKAGFAERFYNIAKNISNVITLRTLCGKSKPYIK